MTAAQQTIPLNVLKCFLSVRRSKTEKITVFFYEILSTAGVFSSGIGFAGESDDETAPAVEAESSAFLTYTENLSGQADENGKKIPPTLRSSLQGILGEILTPEAVRESLEKGENGNRTLEEILREEIAARLGYRATAYIRTERKSSADLADFLGPDFSGETAQANSRNASEGEIGFLIPCMPSIDPLKGIPAAALEKGDSIVVNLPSEGSPLRERLRAEDPGFDGAVRADVLSVHRDRQGDFTILVRLSGEFNGVVTLEGNTKLRRALHDSSSLLNAGPAPAPGIEAEKSRNDTDLPPSVLLLLAGSGSVLLTLLLLFRLFR